MIRKLLILIITLSFTACANVQEKMPKRKACSDDDTGKTLAEVFCKKN
jgi:hypothetical protein|tara:strand:+ start:1071 stop:1214 length:144 start_codon:yes stop_codon:yes gene_type:complete